MNPRKIRQIGSPQKPLQPLMTQSAPPDLIALFPAWEYACPSCRRGFGYNMPRFKSCPHCAAPLEAEKCRVPPRSLSTIGGRFEYAKMYIFPNPSITEVLKMKLLDYLVNC